MCSVRVQSHKWWSREGMIVVQSFVWKDYYYSTRRKSADTKTMYTRIMHVVLYKASHVSAACRFRTAFFFVIRSYDVQTEVNAYIDYPTNENKR